MLRYYSWLPIELEPDYRDGFTCDKCENDFMTGPFFHQDSTGVDYCTECGAAEGLTPFRGLISSLMFNDTGELLRDAVTGHLVVLAYQLHSNPYGLYFSDGSNVVLQTTLSGSTASIHYIAPGGSRAHSRQLDSSAARDRFPWLSGPLFQLTFPVVIQLHDTAPSDALPAAEDLLLSGYDHTDTSFSLDLGGGWQQVFDSQDGVEMVAKDGHVVSIFRPHDTSQPVWRKDDAQRLFDEMTTLLKEEQ